MSMASDIPKRDVKSYFSINLNFNTKHSLERNAGDVQMFLPNLKPCLS